MSAVLWRGSPPSKAVDAAFKAAGFVRVTTESPEAPVVIATESSRLPTVPASCPGWIWISATRLDEHRRREAVLRGAYDALSMSDPNVATDLVARITELLVPLPEPPADGILEGMGESARRVVRQVARVAATSMSVLFTGETGTGKEVLARLTHAWSARHKKPFVPINCAAIPNDLMEAELFGYARGAFSGAIQRYDGQLTAAEGGTVFLDEIDETPLETQVKLLRVLEDRVVSRLGENIWHEVDFRLLAATNRDLRALIEQGLFGADLYARLAIVTIHLLPLRERIEDLPALALHFMARFAREQNQPPVTSVRADALRALEGYPWPGNIRELRNVIYETLVYKRAGTEILLSDLPRRILEKGQEHGRDPSADRGSLARKIAQGTMNLRTEVAALERMAIEEALRRAGGNAAQAARLLGEVGRGMARDPGGTVRAKMRRLKT